MSILTVCLKRVSVFSSILLFLSRGTDVIAQTVSKLNIEQAYQLAQKNYPLTKQRGLITKTKEFTVANTAKGYLPVFSLNGQATYQSAVTNFPFTLPIPGFSLPSYSKDQYKIFAEVDQVVYDGGLIKNQQQVASANELIQQQNLEVELYVLYDRINQLFFGALLIDEQLKQNELVKKDIQNGIDKAKALVANGTAYRSSVDELSAQLLQTDQLRVELKANKKAFIEMLGLFINSAVDENIILEKPAVPVLLDNINRPELLFYDYQKKAYDLQDELLKTQVRPKFSLFAQGGYGRPGLNMLSNDFALYYISGLKLNWNLGSLYTLKNQKQLIDINRKSVDLQKETFLFNTTVIQKQQSAELIKFLELLKKDDAIIALRESVKKAAAAQLENGVLSAHDYINQVNAEDQARQAFILHQMQLLQSQYNYQNTVGNNKNNHSVKS